MACSLAGSCQENKMTRLPRIISIFTGAAGRFSGLAGQILEDRLELLALELREAKIRLVQAWLLACMGIVLSRVGLLLAGVVLFVALSQHLGQKPLAFDQSLAELKEDMTCFSIKK